MIFKDKNPSVFAGLVAALGVTAVLVAPDLAAAEELQAAVVPDQAAVVASAQETDGQAADADEKTSDAGSAAAEDAVVEDDAGKGGSAEDAAGATGADDATGAEDVAGATDTEQGDGAADDASGAGNDGSAECAGDAADAVDAEQGDGKKAEDAVADAGAADAATAPVAVEAAGSAHKDEWVKGADGSYSWYGSDGKQVVSDWVVTDRGLDNKAGALQRYWIKDTGLLAMSELLSFTDYWAYATEHGYVVRGKYTVLDKDGNTLVYLADNDGRLESAGWHVTDAYGDGLQRYYVESDTHSARVGYSEAGFAHYTTEAGYVLRGAAKGSDGGLYYADNSGRLKESGWLVTDAYGQGLQRYWFAGNKVASEGLYQTGASSWAYVTSAGYVLRGAQASGRLVYLADNEGTLAGGSRGGWVVSSAYGQGLQRYWVDPDTHAAVAGYDDGSAHAELGNYAHFTTEAGYALRGVQYLKDAGVVYLGDNDARLARGEGADGTGWLVTDAYGQGLQRYWVEYGGFARVGYSEAGYAHYTTDKGYVLRGAAKGSDGGLYYADNSGRLKESGWLVTDAYGQGLQRYWFAGNKVASEGLYQTGASSWAYVTSAGYVLRGAQASGRLVYLADNEGTLAGGSRGGWVVSSAYGQGLQRYWVDPDTHAAVAGYDDGSAHAELGNYAHFTTEAGYALRGVQYLKDAGVVYLGDNDARLARGEGADGTGWLVTDAYGQGLQRYWVEYGGFARVGYSEAGYAHYTTDKGYVLRGALRDSAGDVYYADNNGKLMESGWLVTADVTGAIERFWIQNYKAARNTFINAGNGWWAYCKDDGTVLRGTGKVDGKVILADNDGRLAGTGWAVANYGKGLQRYYLGSVSGAGYGYALTGFFQAVLGSYGNVWFYGDANWGYVLRGKTNFAGTGMLISNNDGVLAESLNNNVKAGMVVTNSLGDGLQRYYFVQSNGHYYAKTGVFTYNGDHYFGNESTGYLARGKARYGSGMLVADNDGKLLWGNNGSWAVTSQFDGSVQRYYIVTIGKDSAGNEIRGAKIGYFTIGSDEYYGRDDQGYVVRGYWTAPDGMVYYADNDGKLDMFREIRSRIWGWTSGTGYLIVVDSASYRTFIFEGSQYNWKLKYAWACGVWMNGYGPEMHHRDSYGWYNDYTVGGDGACYNYTRWADGRNNFKGGYRASYYPEDDIKWFTGICLDLGFHSTIGWEGGYSDPNQLGVKVSHGCIRLLESNAKWIYDNCGVGTRVRFA